MSDTTAHELGFLPDRLARIGTFIQSKYLDSGKLPFGALLIGRGDVVAHTWASGVGEVIGSNGKGEPGLVLLAFDDRAQQAAALVALEAGARRQGLTFAAEPLDAVLTLVRLGRE